MKIMVIDGNSIINRSFYAIPILTNSEGVYTNAIYGFLNILFKLLEEETPDYLAVTFDLPFKTFRHKKYTEYKNNRKTSPSELQSQIILLKSVLDAMDIGRFELEGYEGDDLVGTIVNKASKVGIEAVIISGDTDLFQLITDKVKLKIPKTKAHRTETESYYASDFEAKYSINPKEYIDFKALKGDSSDNVPGVPGIGDVTANRLIQTYHSVENAIVNVDKIQPKRIAENLKKFKDTALMSKELITIDCNAPIEIDFDKLKLRNILTDKAYDLFKSLELKTFLDKFKPNYKKYQLTLDDAQVITNITSLNDINSNQKVAYTIFYEEGKLVAISLYTEKELYWFEVNQTLSEFELLSKLKPFFENEKLKKIAHNKKSDLNFLRSHNIFLRGIVFDTMIAAYILNPIRETYNYDDLALEYLGEKWLSEEEILGKGKLKKRLAEIESNKRLEFGLSYSSIIYRVMPIINKKLREQSQSKLYYKIEYPLIEVLSSMEKYGIKIDKAALIKYNQALSVRIDLLTSEIYSLAGCEFNINSPKQLGVILFEKLGLKSNKKTKTGYSTSADILEKLASDNLIVRKILEYRTLIKLKSTYADGLLNVMDLHTNKIYSTFNQTITSTGRISSTEPNLQNIPIKMDLGRELRKIFITEDDSFIFVDADYSQIELRVLACMSNDETLIKAFQENQDIHKLTASQVFKIPFNEVTAIQRSNAKAVNFGIIYGMGSFSLSEDLNITKKEADIYIEGYFEKYPNVKVYLNRLIEDAELKGYSETLFHRRRLIPDINSKNFINRSFSERVAMNTPIQGTAADIIKIAMVRVYNRLKAENLKSRLILQVHDELLIEAKKDEVDKVKKILEQEMKYSIEIDIIKELINLKIAQIISNFESYQISVVTKTIENAVLDIINLSVPMAIDIHEGKTWFETK